VKKEDVVIKHFKHIGCDERGNTSEFSLSRKQQDFICITRKKGTISGNNYHTGKSAGTCPKTFVLISGNIELSYRAIGNNNKKTAVNVACPALIEIQPNVIHSIKALTEITVLECNSLSEIQGDNFKEKV
jgi:hypothetical protein